MSKQDTPAPYHGLYINLERSVQRRERMDTQLAELGLEGRYVRFPAVDGAAIGSAGTVRPGERGAFHSHAKALEEARSHRGGVHILEDDAVLSHHVRPVIDEAIIAAKLFERFDLVFTDMMLSCHLGVLKFLKGAYDRLALPRSGPLRLSDLQVIDLKQQNFACLTSYVVSEGAIDRVLRLYRQEIEQGPRMPVDLFVRDCVHTGKLRAACLFPFLTSFKLEELFGSTIAGEAGAVANPSVTVLAALRYSFFVERNLEAAKRYLDAATRSGRKPTNTHHDLIVQVLEFVMSEDFKEF
jgi:GR25 family glycosyltransferase involved in LPS biosynthesis